MEETHDHDQALLEMDVMSTGVFFMFNICA